MKKPDDFEATFARIRNAAIRNAERQRLDLPRPMADIRGVIDDRPLTVRQADMRVRQANARRWKRTRGRG